MDIDLNDVSTEDTNTPEEVNQEEKLKKQIEEQLTNEDVHWLDSIAFNELFRVYGKPGIWLIGSGMNRSGMLKMKPFLDATVKPIITHQKHLKPLEFEYATGLKIGEDDDERDVTLKDLFFEIEDYINDSEIPQATELILRGLDKEQVYSSNLVPEIWNGIGADDDDIPSYVAVKLIKLYFSLKDRYDAFIEKEIADAKKIQEEKEKAGDEIQHEEG